jgi:hypothetical protein
MCIAILNTPNVTFSKSLIRNCWENNGDGAGLIYTDTKRKALHTFKELNSLEAYYAKYIEVRRKHPKSKVVLHFRISTSGGVNIQNTHPFIVNDALAFVHNGVISELNGIDKDRSDTNLFNERILKGLPIGFERNETIAKIIGKYIGHSKLVFLNALNEALIVNTNLGVTDPAYAECWFSNNTYKPSAFYDYGGTKIYKKTKAPQLPETHIQYWETGATWDREVGAYLRADAVWDAKQQKHVMTAKIKTTTTPQEYAKPWQRPYQMGDVWNDITGGWEAPKQEAKPTNTAVRYWNKDLQDFESKADEIYIQPFDHIDTSLSPAEEMRLAYLRRQPINEMTAEEWEELNNLELLTYDF